MLVAGYPDIDAPRPLGCAFKEMAVTVSWARLLATFGLAAVTYSTRAPESDGAAALRFLEQHQARLGVDATRVALWATSGHVPTALGLLLREPGNFAGAILSNRRSSGAGQRANQTPMRSS